MLGMNRRREPPVLFFAACRTRSIGHPAVDAARRVRPAAPKRFFWFSVSAICCGFAAGPKTIPLEPRQWIAAWGRMQAGCVQPDPRRRKSVGTRGRGREQSAASCCGPLLGAPADVARSARGRAMMGAISPRARYHPQQADSRECAPAWHRYPRFRDASETSRGCALARRSSCER